MSASAPPARSGDAAWKLRWKWLLGGVAATVCVIAATKWPLRDWLQHALDRASQLGFLGVLLFVATYVLATVLFLPGSVLTLGAGAVFGVAWGSVYVSIASTLGATAAFVLGRYVARDAISKKMQGDERFSAIEQAVSGEGWKIVILTRLSPLFPFSLLNYAFGLTSVRLSHYVLASWIGMMPGTVMYVYLGSLANPTAAGRARTPVEWVLYGVGLLATVLVAVLVTRLARKALAQRLATHRSTEPSHATSS